LNDLIIAAFRPTDRFVSQTDTIVNHPVSYLDTDATLSVRYSLATWLNGLLAFTQ
jgi:hypothetical protein